LKYVVFTNLTLVCYYSVKNHQAVFKKKASLKRQTDSVPEK